VLGETVFEEGDWRVIGEYVYDAEGGRHQAFYAPYRDTTVLGELVRPHERIQVEESLKWSPEETQKLWKAAGLAEIGKWMRGNEYGEFGPGFSDCREKPVCTGQKGPRPTVCPSFQPHVFRDTWGRSFFFALLACHHRVAGSSFDCPSGSGAGLRG